MSNSVPPLDSTRSIRVYEPSLADRDGMTRAIRAAFGMLGEPTYDREHLRPADRRLVVADGEAIIGGCFSYPFRMSLPGGTTVPVAGLAGVGISPAAQGRGAFRPLMEAHLRQSAALGDAASLLMASESGLYGRFGYGQATDMAVWRLDTREFALREPLTPEGEMVLLNNTREDIPVLAAVHEAACRRRGGDVLRSVDWWAQIVGEKEKTWFGGGDQFVAIWRSAAGTPEAYALYTLSDIAPDRGQPGTPVNRINLRELVAASTLSEVALFAALCRIAWVREIQWELAPVDPPVRLLMTDPRQLHQVRRLDMSWLRPLDPVALLQARTYLAEGDVTLKYDDPILPEQSGGIRISVVDGVGSVTRVSDASSASIALNPITLGMTVLGGTRVLELADAAQIQGMTADLRKLDQLLLCERAPFNLSKF